MNQHDMIRLLDYEARPLEWIWDHRLAAGTISNLEGPPEAGKSTIISDLIARITSGRPMPGCRSSNDPANVVLYNGEESLDFVRPALAAAGADLSRVIVPNQNDWDSPAIVLPAAARVVERTIEQHRPKLTVFSPLTAFVQSLGSEHTVRRSLLPLWRIADKYGTAILLVRHLSKRHGSDPVCAGAGSIALTALARQVLLVGRDPNEPDRRVLAVGKTNVGRAAPSLAFEIVDLNGTPGVHWLGETPLQARDLLDDKRRTSSPMLDEAQQFLEAKLADGPMLAKELLQLAREEGLAEKTLQRAKAEMGVLSERAGFGPGSYCSWRLPGKADGAGKDASSTMILTGVGGEPIQAFVSTAVEAGAVEPSEQPEDTGNTTVTDAAPDRSENAPVPPVYITRTGQATAVEAGTTADSEETDTDGASSTVAEGAVPTTAGNLICYSRTLTTDIVDSPAFAEKRLADHVVNPGIKCSHGCTYCSTPSVNRCSLHFKKVGRKPCEPGYAIVDPKMPARVRLAVPKLGPAKVLISGTVDAWAPEAQLHRLGRQCLEATLENPQIAVRLLTKNAAVAADFDLLERERHRCQVSLSLTGTPAKSEIIQAIEPNASSIEERMAAIREAARRGLRVYGMLCPLLPGIADDEASINELVEFLLDCGAEEVFAEPVNARGGGLKLTEEALQRQGFEHEADAVHQIRKEAAWSRYTTGLLATVQRVLRRHGAIDKLRFLLYTAKLKSEDRARIDSDPEGAIFLK